MTKEDETTAYNAFEYKGRMVYEPSPTLKHSLRDANAEVYALLDADDDFHRLYSRDVVHGFVNKRNVHTHAGVHRRAITVFQLDIRHAFQSTPQESVLTQLEALGASERLRDFVAGNAFVEGVLPAGFPTSQTLFNVAMLPVDRELFEFAQENGLTYSRYADDLAFSTQKPYLFTPPMNHIQEIIGSHGYDTHELRVGHPQRHAVEVCGVYIERGRFTLPQKTIDRIRGQVHRSLHIETPPKPQRALGLIGYVKGVKGRIPNNMHQDWILATQLAAQYRASGIKP